MSIRIKEYGKVALLSAFEELQTRATNIHWFWETQDLQDYIFQLQTKNFDTQGQGEWADLKERTLREKARLGYGDKPSLVREGELRESIISRDAPGSVWQPSTTSLTWGSEFQKARGQHYGIPARNLPARSLLAKELQEETASAELIDIFTNELANFARALGFVVTDNLQPSFIFSISEVLPESFD